MVHSLEYHVCPEEGNACLTGWVKFKWGWEYLKWCHNSGEFCSSINLNKNHPLYKEYKFLDLETAVLKRYYFVFSANYAVFVKGPYISSESRTLEINLTRNTDIYKDTFKLLNVYEVEVK